MTIEMRKFGFVLTSREAGKEALAAFAPSLPTAGEEVVVDFAGVNTLSPSWADEFLTPLAERFGERLRVRSSSNPSVRETLKLLEEIHGYRFNVIRD